MFFNKNEEEDLALTGKLTKRPEKDFSNVLFLSNQLQKSKR